MDNEEIIRGTFITESKNRFICMVLIGDKIEECYVSSSCRLSNFVDLSGKQVLLKPVKSPSARTKYSLYAVKYRNRTILLNMSLVNRIVEAHINDKLFAFLGDRSSILREKSIQGYKSDLYIPDTHTIIEIKSILSFEEQALFPTVYSERALSQLHAMKNLLKNGYSVWYVFVSLNPGVKEINLLGDNGGFQHLFRECCELGMNTKSIAIRFKNCIPTVSKGALLEIPIYSVKPIIIGK